MNLRTKLRWTMGFLAFAILGVLAFRLAPQGPSPVALPVYGEIDSFSLVDQDGKPFEASRLAGSVVVVNFIFSSCPGVCPLLTQQMAKVQALLEEKKLPSKLLSISVDPPRDTPQVLRAYASKYGADFQRWSFLTGDLEVIRKVVVESFKTMMGPEKNEDVNPNPDLFEIVHGEHFVVLDQKSRIRAFQKMKTPEDLRQLLRTIEILEKADVS